MANDIQKIQGLGNFCADLEGDLNESRNLVFLCFFCVSDLEVLAARSRSLGFLLVGQRF